MCTNIKRQQQLIIKAVETGVTSERRNFPAIEFAGNKSPDLAFSNVDRYANKADQSCKRAYKYRPETWKMM